MASHSHFITVGSTEATAKGETCAIMGLALSKPVKHLSADIRAEDIGMDAMSLCECELPLGDRELELYRSRLCGFSKLAAEVTTRLEASGI